MLWLSLLLLLAFTGDAPLFLPLALYLHSTSVLVKLSLPGRAIKFAAAYTTASRKNF